MSGFPTLRLMDLSGCKIDDWSQVLSLGRIKNLEELILDSNPIPSVLPCPNSNSLNAILGSELKVEGVTIVDESLSSDCMFTSLQRLSLSCSLLSSWKDIDAISTYPSCRILRLSQVPLFTGKGASEVRPLVIGRMSSLVFFNGSGISPRERTDAEKSYLRSIMFAIDDAAALGLLCLVFFNCLLYFLLRFYRSSVALFIVFCYFL